ncbi:hypothetical protein NDU88_006764 [Pleurodeles waltl]|uniref:Uncharacterized protein n=1 Tax=Pleurodeles waltl TaxID=8319 RepID=A0AAV7NZ10_PLEWA|nr:hypothetical protein NDU88_006764 [Pleurodeles waltl]
MEAQLSISIPRAATGLSQGTQERRVFPRSLPQMLTTQKIEENAGKLREVSEQRDVEGDIKKTAWQQEGEEEDVERQKGDTAKPTERR